MESRITSHHEGCYAHFDRHWYGYVSRNVKVVVVRLKGKLNLTFGTKVLYTHVRTKLTLTHPNTHQH